MVSSQKHIGFWGVVAIGIGGMVGGGIFAVLGISVELSHGGAPLSFAIAGLVALVTGFINLLQRFFIIRTIITHSGNS